MYKKREDLPNPLHIQMDRREIVPEKVLGIKQTATEETLQSIDATLKRIETILQIQLQNQFSASDARGRFSQQ